MDQINAETFPYEKRYWYPHLKPEDIKIWEKFIEENPNVFDYCQYDVPVGSDPEFDTNVSGNEDDESWKLYQKKIDVLATRGDKLTIIELKPNAKAAAVGQVKQYKHLFMKDYTPPVPPKTMIITDNASKDLLSFANEEDVSVIVV